MFLHVKGEESFVPFPSSFGGMVDAVDLKSIFV